MLSLAPVSDIPIASLPVEGTVTPPSVVINPFNGLIISYAAVTAVRNLIVAR